MRRLGYAVGASGVFLGLVAGLAVLSPLIPPTGPAPDPIPLARSAEPEPAPSSSTTLSPAPSRTPSPPPTAAPRVSPTPTRPAPRPSTTPTPRPSAPAPSRTPAPTPKATPRATPKPTKPRLPTDPASLPGASRGSRGVVYLTFDDGPGPSTPAVLAILRRTGSTATFFQLGMRQQQYPGLVRAVRSSGSRIANHTYDHADLTRLTKKQIRAEIARGPRARCMRPPYGATNATVRAQIRAAGMRQVLWDVDTFDWRRPGAELIYRRAAGPAVRNGTVVLMHDAGGDRAQTVAALPRIIAQLQRRGYVIRALPGC